MTDAAHEHAYYAVSRPTLWQRLGFGECHALRHDEDEYAEGFAPSWFIVGTRIRLDWKDRLRALVSGNLMVECACKTDAIIKKSRATSAVSVLPPGPIRKKTS
jgi:hypothetical protein